MLELSRTQAKITPSFGWRPPDVGWMKINTDACVAFDDHQCGAGGVARSSSGFVGAWSKPHPGVTNPLVAEALALHDGFMFAQLRGYANVVMEVDCFEVVNQWRARQTCAR